MKKKQYFCTRFRQRSLSLWGVNATVAQLVEQRIRNAWVGGSSPPSGSEKVVLEDGTLVNANVLFFLCQHAMPLMLTCNASNANVQYL